ncbi:MAG: DUF6923 family protein [Janthinobacterium lividum]
MTTGNATPLTTSGIPLTSNGTSVAATRLNSFGFNPNDKYIWGQVYNQDQVVRIGSEYTGQIFSVTNLPKSPYVVGDVSPGSIMYLAVGGTPATNTIYVIDLNQPTSSLRATTLPTTASYITDWAVSPIDGNLYALYSALNGQTALLTLYRFLTADRTNADGSVDLAGKREVLGEVSGGSPAIAPSNFGSAFMDLNGSFYVVNTVGAIYRIDSPESLAVNGSPNAIYIAQPKTSPDASNTDGARCATSRVVPLPVTLTSFTATAAASRSVQLNWTTASERNNDFFEVQHSLDGQTFAAVGRVAGQQTKLRASAYSFVHATPGASAKHYYRLRQVDLDGTSTFSPVQAVSLTAPTQWQLSAAPNPTTADDLRVQVQAAAAATAVLEVRGLLGQCLLKQAVTLQPGPNQLALSTQLPPGIYWVSLAGENASSTKGVKVFLTK